MAAASSTIPWKTRGSTCGAYRSGRGRWKWRPCAFDSRRPGSRLRGPFASRSVNAVDVKTLAVVGAGQMGAGIAQVAAQSGISVVLVDVNARSPRAS